MAYKDDLSEWWGWGHGGGESERGAVGGEMGGVSCAVTNPREVATSGRLLSPYLSRGELAAENRRLYLDNMRLWDCLALFRTDPSLTCQGAINTIFTLDDTEYLREFPDTQQLLSSRFSGRLGRHREELDAVSENSRLREENARLHAAVWVLRDNPSLIPDATVAAIFRLSDEQFQKKFGVINQVRSTAGLCYRNIFERSSRNNNKVKVKAMRTHLNLGARTNTIHLIKKPIGPRRLTRAQSVSTSRQMSPLGENSITALALAKKRSESAEPPQNFSSNRKPTTAEEVQDFLYGHNYHGPLLSFEMPPPVKRNTNKKDGRSGEPTRKSKLQNGVLSSRSDSNQTCLSKHKGSKKHNSRSQAAKPIKCVSFEEPLPTTHDDSQEIFSRETYEEKSAVDKTSSGLMCFKDRLLAILNTPSEHDPRNCRENGAIKTGDVVELSGRKERAASKKTRHRSTSLTHSPNFSTGTTTRDAMGGRSSVNRRKGSAQRCDSWEDLRGSNSNRMGNRCPADDDYSDDDDDDDDDDDYDGNDVEGEDVNEEDKGGYGGQAYPRSWKCKRMGKFRGKHIHREPSKRHKEEIRLSPVLDPRTSLHRLHISAGDGSRLDMEPARSMTTTEIGSLPLDRNFNRTRDDMTSSEERFAKTWQRVSFSERPAASRGETQGKHFESSTTGRLGCVHGKFKERGFSTEGCTIKLPYLKNSQVIRNRSSNKAEVNGQIENVRARKQPKKLNDASLDGVKEVPPLEDKGTLESNCNNKTDPKKNVFTRSPTSKILYSIGGSVFALNNPETHGVGDDLKSTGHLIADTRKPVVSNAGRLEPITLANKAGKFSEQGCGQNEDVGKARNVLENNKYSAINNLDPNFQRSRIVGSEPNIAERPLCHEKNFAQINLDPRFRRSQTMQSALNLDKRQSANVETEEKNVFNRDCMGSKKVSSFVKSKNATEDVNKNRVSKAQISNNQFKEHHKTTKGLDQTVTSTQFNRKANTVFVDHKHRTFRRSSGSVDQGGLVIDTSGASQDRLRLAPTAEVTPYDTSRKTRPKSAARMRAFNAARQANLKNSDTFLKNSEQADTGKSQWTKNVAEEQRPKSPPYRRPKRRAVDVEPKSDTPCIYYTGSSYRHVLPAGTSYSARSSMLKQVGLPNSDEFCSQPTVYLSTEPAPERASRYKPYPHKTYVTVKQFTDRHQRLMPQPAAPMIRRLTSTMFSFSRERSPSMALLLDDDYQRWMSNRVCSTDRYQIASYGDHHAQRRKSHLYRHHLERWPSVRPLANSILHIADRFKSSVATLGSFKVAQGSLKGSDNIPPCTSNHETRLRMLKELGGVKYRGALAAMIKRNIQDKKPCPRQN